MGEGLRDWRILLATGFSIALIVGAYLLAHGINTPPRAEASTEAVLLQAIATKDSDGDGLPDWEEALYGTDPHTIDTRGLGMSDADAVAKGLIVPKAIADASINASAEGVVVDPSLPPAPTEGTLTAAFARNFFTLYMAALQRTGGNLSESDMSGVAEQALADLSASIVRAPDFKSVRDITVEGSGADALKAFAAAAEAVMQTNTSNANKSELLYLQDAATGKDPGATAHIASIAKAYRASAVGIAMLPVPRELASADLVLVNALARTSQIAGDFALIESDPLATMLALQQYPGTVIALADAFIAFANAYKTAGITLAPGTPGARFVSVIADIATEQARAKKQP